MVRSAFRLAGLIGFVAICGIASAARSEVGVSSQEIRFGMVTSFSGPVGVTGDQIRMGYESAFRRFNAEGGIFGRKLELHLYDDKYDPALTAIETNEVVRQKRDFALVGVNGTSPAATALPLAVRDGIPMLFPRSGIASLRDFHRNVFNFRPAFSTEIDSLVQYAIRTGHQRIAIYFQTDSFGDSLRGSAIQAIQSHHDGDAPKIQLVAVSGIDRETTADKYIQANFARIEHGDPDVVILATSIPASAPFVRLASARKKKWLFLAVSSTNNLVEKIHGVEADIVFSQVVPDPLHSLNLPIVAEYREDMRKNGSTDLGYNSFEAYLNGRLLGEALLRGGPTPTRKKLIASLEGDPFPMGGLSFDWSDQDHNGTTPVYLTRSQAGGYVPVTIPERK